MMGVPEMREKGLAEYMLFQIPCDVHWIRLDSECGD